LAETGAKSCCIVLDPTELILKEAIETSSRRPGLHIDWQVSAEPGWFRALTSRLNQPCYLLPLESLIHPRLIPSLNESLASFGDIHPEASQILGLTPAALRQLGQALPADPGSMTELCEQASRCLPLHEVRRGDLFATIVDRATPRTNIVDLLFATTRKKEDGIVSQHINRKISSAISRPILESWLTPNMMTGVAFLLGLIGVGLATIGGYLATLASCFFYQMHSVVDGCDGELAVIKHQRSPYGAHLDTACDMIINILFPLALGVGLSRQYDNRLFLGLGVAVLALGLANILILVLASRRYSHKKGSLDGLGLKFIETDGTKASFLMTRFKKMLRFFVKRDFYVFLFLVLAFFNLAAGILYLAVTGLTVMLGIIVFIQLKDRKTSLALGLIMSLLALNVHGGEPKSRQVLEDFNNAKTGVFPDSWDARNKRGKKYYLVQEENSQKFLHATVPSDSVHIYKKVDWDVKALPILTWRWRVSALPPEGNEQNPAKNDTAAAVYVTWVNKWKMQFFSLKYIWSTSLVSGTSFRQKDTWVVVVDSGPQNLGQWITHTVDVRADYERLFGQKISDPHAIAILSDSNTTKSTVVADYDDFVASIK
jgi:phosphatidylglycerophosphate synthase